MPLKRRFSRTIYTNQPFGVEADARKIKELFRGRLSTAYVDAFVRKRFLGKEEIWPKILVAGCVNSLRLLPSIQPYLATPRLMSATEIEESQERGAESPHLLHSVLFEPNLHELLREYSRKIPVCGIVPLLGELPQFRQIEHHVDSLFRQFFSSEKTFPDFQMQRTLARFALEKRELISVSAPESNVDRILADVKNYQIRDLEHFDDFTYRYTLHNLDTYPSSRKESFWSRISPFSMKNAIQRTQINTQALRLLHRTKSHVNSIDYCHRFELSSDFFVTWFNVFFHVWVLCARLGQLSQSAPALYLRERLISCTNQGIEEELKPLHIRSKGLLTHEAKRHFENLSNLLSQHFTARGFAADPRRQLDAFVWSLVLRESVHRYHDSVFALAEYFLCTWQAVQDLTLEEIIHGQLPFNVFAPDPNYQARGLLTNPPLDAEDFAAESISDKMPKKYHYRQTLSFTTETGSCSAGFGLAQTRWLRLAQKIRKRFNNEHQSASLFDFYVPESKHSPSQSSESAWEQQASGQSHQQLTALKEKVRISARAQA